MKIKYNKKIYGIAIAATVAAMLPAGAGAQLKETVEVHGEYQKEILYPDKIGKLPQRLRRVAPPSDIPYYLKGVEAEFTPWAAPIGTIAAGATRSENPARGYLDVEMGSYLNASLSAGYALIDDENQSLNVWLRHGSTSLWEAYKDEYKDRGMQAPKRKSYQERIGIRWRRNIGEIGQLTADAAYRLGYFNYYGIRPFDPSEDPIVVLPAGGKLADAPKLPTHTINDLSAGVGFNSMPYTPGSGEKRDRWGADFGLRYFGFNSASKETHLRLSGNYSRQIGATPDYGLTYPSAIGVDMAFDGLIYSDQTVGRRPDNYGNLRVSPFYRFNAGDIGLRVGLNADFTFNADGVAEGDRVWADGHYSAVHVSPDVRFDYGGGIVSAYVHATGGQQLLTLASIADRNMYCLPYMQSTTPIFVPIDAKAGVRISPVSGLSIEFGAGYRLTRNVPYCGWDVELLNMMYYPGVNLLPAGDPTGAEDPMYGIGGRRYNLSGIYIDADFRYKIGKIMDVHAGMKYAPQNEKHGIFNGADRPRWVLNPGVEVTPIEALTLGVDYEYRGVRTIRAEGIAERLPDITKLNARAEYRFGDLGALKNFSIGLKADNLLNHNYILLPGLPTEGLTLSGIIRMQF